MVHRLTPPPLGLYIHLPWCVQKCPYCDFNSHALRGALPERAYVDALLRDAERLAPAIQGRVIETVFIGGGTPSLFSASEIARLLSGLAMRLSIRAGAEITLEANPGTVEQARFRGFLEAGVNRLSIGVQSFDDRQLRQLGRVHDGEAARQALIAAGDAGFSRINADLMHGLPGQTPDAALVDVEKALDLGIRHVSHYQLTLEPGTAFHHRPPALPDEDTLADIESVTADALSAAGLARYEVSAWATPGEACRHNLNYWRFGDYLALGAGGHGKLSSPDGRITRYSLVRMPRQYLALAGTPQSTAESHDVPPEERALEYLMNALRLSEGVPVAEALARTGLDWSAFAEGVAAARTRGWLTDEADWLIPTRAGLRYLNDLLGLFLEPPAAQPVQAGEAGRG